MSGGRDESLSSTCTLAHAIPPKLETPLQTELLAAARLVLQGIYLSVSLTRSDTLIHTHAHTLSGCAV